MLKILQARLQQYVNRELPDAQVGFWIEKAEEAEIKLPIYVGSLKKQEFQKNIYFCFIDFGKPFLSITTNCGKVLKRWKYQTTLPVSWETCMQDKKQQLELDMEQ